MVHMDDDHRMTITVVARKVGVTPKTITRWENARKVKKSKRDWRGWRIYSRADLDELRKFHDSIHY